MKGEDAPLGHVDRACAGFADDENFRRGSETQIHYYSRVLGEKKYHEYSQVDHQ